MSKETPTVVEPAPVVDSVPAPVVVEGAPVRRALYATLSHEKRDPFAGAPSLASLLAPIAGDRGWSVSCDRFGSYRFAWSDNAEIDDVDAGLIDDALAAWQPDAVDLADAQAVALVEVTAEHRARPSSFEFRGKRFGLTLEDRVNIGHLAMFADAMPYPLAIYTVDERDTISIASATEARAFAAAAVGAYLADRAAVQARKSAILAADTLDGIKAARRG